MMEFTDSRDGHSFPVRTLLLAGAGYAFSADGSILTIRNPIPTIRSDPTLFAESYLAGSADGKVPLRPLGLIKIIGAQDPGETYLGGSFDITYGVSLGGWLATFRADPTHPPTVTVTDLGNARCRLDFAPGQPGASTISTIGWDSWLTSVPVPGSAAMPDCTTLTFPPAPPPARPDTAGGASLYPGVAEALTMPNTPPYHPWAGRFLTNHRSLTSAFAIFSFFLPPGESLSSFYGVNHLSLLGRTDPHFIEAYRKDPAPHTEEVVISGSRDILLSWGWDTYDPARPETVGQSAYSQVRAERGTVLGTVEDPTIDLTELCSQTAPPAPNQVGPKLWFALAPSPLSPDGFVASGWTFVTQDDMAIDYYADLADMTRFDFLVLSVTASP